MELKYKIWLDKNGKAFGEGPYQLLKGVKSTGSLAQAAKNMNMSYSRAHTLMKTLGKNLGYPLIESQAGGRGGGLTIITLQGEELMDRYDAFLSECDLAINSAFNKYFKYAQINQVETKTRKYKSSAIKTLGLGPAEVITLSGGGGKTSIMFTLAEELALSGYKVAVTTTTHIYFPSHGAVDRMLVFDEKDLMQHLEESIEGVRIVALGTGIQNGRLMAVSNEFICELAQSKLVDYIIVEADGAAHKPFKAPREGEPVIPDCTTLALTVVGIDVLGRELNNYNTHRPEKIAALTNLKDGENIQASDIAQVICHPEGGRKSVPAGARWYPVVNKVDERSLYNKANKIAEQMAERGAENVFITTTLGGVLRIRPWKKS